MMSKNKNTRDPAQYRPMACLLTIYKLFIVYLANKIYAHVEANNTLVEQQIGCRKEHISCKEQLVIDSVVMRQAHTPNRNLHMVYIDFKKDYDSIPHSWMIEVL